MREGTPSPQINVSKIPGGAGIAGALFAVISMVIFLIGIPALRYMLPAAVVLGSGVALVLHFIRHETAGASWILPASKK
jgi:hypothetical protein